MDDEKIFARAKAVIGEENIVDHRPAYVSTQDDGFLAGVEAFVPNTIMIWLKNGDCIWYRAEEGDGDETD